MKTVAIIILVLALVVAHICCIIRASELKKRKEILDFKEGRLSEEHRLYLNNMAALQAKEESVNKKQKDADDAWEKCLEEGHRLMEKQHELEAREAEIEKREKELKDKKADVSTREAILGLMGVPEAQDIIEPVEEPAKPVKKARKAKK